MTPPYHQVVNAGNFVAKPDPSFTGQRAVKRAEQNNA